MQRQQEEMAAVAAAEQVVRAALERPVLSLSALCAALWLVQFASQGVEFVLWRCLAGAVGDATFGAFPNGVIVGIFIGPRPSFLVGAACWFLVRRPAAIVEAYHDLRSVLHLERFVSEQHLSALKSKCEAATEALRSGRAFLLDVVPAATATALNSLFGPSAPEAAAATTTTTTTSEEQRSHVE